MKTSIALLSGLLSPLWLAAGAFAANPDHVKRLLKTNQCPMCDLSGANLEGANLDGAVLINANLRGANLKRANLGSSNLTDADLSGADLSGTYLHLANLENTNFSKANLQTAYLREALLLNTNFKDANLQGVNLSRSNLVGIGLQGVNLSEANLSGAILSGVRTKGPNPDFDTLWLPMILASWQDTPDCKLPESREMNSIGRAGYDLVFADLSGANLRGANLSRAVLFRGDLSKADLTGADLQGTMLICSNLKNAILDKANLKDAGLNYAMLEGASLKDTRNANLQEAFQSEADSKNGPAQGEAKRAVGSLLRGQQAYYLENSKFASMQEFEALGIGIEQNTESYMYRIFSFRDRTKAVMVAAVPRKGGFKSYVGYVTVGTTPSNEATTVSRLCESEQSTKPQLPQMPASFPARGPAPCPAGFKAADSDAKPRPGMGFPGRYVVPPAAPTR